MGVVNFTAHCATKKVEILPIHKREYNVFQSSIFVQIKLKPDLSAPIFVLSIGLCCLLVSAQ